MCKEWKIHYIFRARPNMGEVWPPEQMNANIEHWQELRHIDRETRKQNREVNFDE